MKIGGDKRERTPGTATGGGYDRGARGIRRRGRGRKRNLGPDKDTSWVVIVLRLQVEFEFDGNENGSRSGEFNCSSDWG